MPHKDPEARKKFRREQMRRLRAERPEHYRAVRAESARRRRAEDPYRGKSREEFLADCRKHSQTRRARKLGQFIEHVDPQVVYAMHGGRCGICGQFISGEFHVDHVVPLARGGAHGYINVQPAHPTCNLRKGAS